MATAKAKFPTDEITGILGKTDRSMGRDGGLALIMAKSPHSTTLGVKTQATSTRSPGQQARSQIYCDCDHLWPTIPLNKKAFLMIYHTQVRKKSSMHMTDYLCWMSLCMTTAWENDLFLLDSYVSRYVIKNTSGAPWSSKKISLINVPILQLDGTDVIVVQTTYHRLPTATLTHRIDTPGKVTVCIPDMAPGKTIFIDCYSYGYYSNAQTCI